MSYKIHRSISVALVTLALCASLLPACKGKRQAVSHEPGSVDTLTFARGIEIAHFDDFTSVTLRDPWDTVKTRKVYVLVPRTILANRPGLKDTLSKNGIVIATPVE